MYPMYIYLAVTADLSGMLGALLAPPLSHLSSRLLTKEESFSGSFISGRLV